MSALSGRVVNICVALATGHRTIITLSWLRVAFVFFLFVDFGTEGRSWSATTAPILRFTVEPAAAGEQLVRASLPFAAGTLHDDKAIIASDEESEVPATIRPLTWHGGEAKQRSIRRALVTFPYRFKNRRPVTFSLIAAEARASSHELSPVDIGFVENRWELVSSSGVRVHARPIWPEFDSPVEWQREVIENNQHFRWERWKRQNALWGQTVEVRADALGQVVLVAHLQRREAKGDWAPPFGWDLAIVCKGANARGRASDLFAAEQELVHQHSFETGRPYECWTDSKTYRINHPAAHWKRRGGVYMAASTHDLLRYRYLRSEGSDRVPMQRYAWQRAEVVISPVSVALPTATLTSPHAVHVDWKAWEALYNVGPPLNLGDTPQLERLYEFHRDATLACAAVGNDWGNVTTYDPTLTHGGILGMNRLNHCPAIFFEAMRTGDRRLTQTALAWCDNFYDLTIWWGPEKTGGTRYNNLLASNETPPEDDNSFMWRSDRAVHFCTKGYDSLLLAYEETGDPRMKEALDAQVAYAAEHVHAGDDEARNIGDVADFVRLYEFTGEQRYLDQGLRLFRELRGKLSPANLFSQECKPIVSDPPFIDEDERGKKHPFAKPYIIGYGLTGCPALIRYAPDEPRLKDMIRAVADFMAESQDPIGGWRYPHPQSSRVVMSQALEHAWQLVQASQVLGPKDEYLDAIERVLRQRLWIWSESGQVLNLLHGWELSTGEIADPLEIYKMYNRPAERDATRDYSEGKLGLEPCSPESLVYFPEVLRFYLQHRPASRLLERPREGSPLHEIVTRLSHDPMLQTVGVRDGLPVFYERLSERLSFPLAWDKSKWPSFEAWQEAARRRVRETWLKPPPDAPFDASILASRKCDGYQSHKIAFNVTGDSRVLAYLLVPDGEGPFPAVLLLHDHGGEQRIGKEKIIQPWDDRPEKIELAHRWMNEYYGGRFLGDELAKRGYVCLAVDALNWSDRGGAGQKGQQQVASNLLHLGMSFAGLIAHEDMRAAAFLAQRSEVDSRRIAAMGLSMGGFRTWQVAAMSPDIAAGVAVCWMATVKGLMVPGGNQTEGQSAFTMTHPGLLADLDYPDVASLACPKPMLFYNGRRDKLFPVLSVEDAYKKMRDVWQSQDADDRLVTKLWDVPHEFNREMKKESFEWLDRRLATKAKKSGATQ